MVITWWQLLLLEQKLQGGVIIIFIVKCQMAHGGINQVKLPQQI